MSQNSLKQIHAEIERLKAQASQIEDQERKTAIKTIKALVAQFNIMPYEVGYGQNGGKSINAVQKIVKKKAAAKYKKGDLTWSGGRGVKPRWVREIIEKDGKEALERFRIKASK